MPLQGGIHCCLVGEETSACARNGGPSLRIRSPSLHAKSSKVAFTTDQEASGSQSNGRCQLNVGAALHQCSAPKIIIIWAQRSPPNALTNVVQRQAADLSVFSTRVSTLRKGTFKLVALNVPFSYASPAIEFRLLTSRDSKRVGGALACVVCYTRGWPRRVKYYGVVGSESGNEVGPRRCVSRVLRVCLSWLAHF